MQQNADQSDFWNGAPGRRWVALHDDLEELHAPVSDLILSAAAPLDGARILDIGCGAGSLTIAARQAAGPRGTALGADLSEPLLDAARNAAGQTGIGDIRFEAADAQTHSWPDAGFDRLLSRFGVMFFDDFPAAFANLYRTLAPGGRAVLAVWADAAANPWFRDTKSAAVARLGAGPPADPDAPGPMALRDPRRGASLLRDAGFSDPEARLVDLTLHHRGGWDAMTRVLPQIGPVAATMRDRNGTPEDLAAILADLRGRWSPYLDETGLTLPARLVLYTAGKGDS
jgi:SAM-dependent methyltransferase